MILLNNYLRLTREFEQRAMSAVYFTLQSLFVGCIVYILAGFLSGIRISGKNLELEDNRVLWGIQQNRPGYTYHHDSCNVTFEPTSLLAPVPFFAVLMPSARLDYEAGMCLLASLADNIMYQISCVLLTVALLFVLTAILILGIFMMDIFYHFWLAVMDTTVHTAANK
jgi:hypothetical protein